MHIFSSHSQGAMLVMLAMLAMLGLCVGTGMEQEQRRQQQQ